MLNKALNQRHLQPSSRQNNQKSNQQNNRQNNRQDNQEHRSDHYVRNRIILSAAAIAAIACLIPVGLIQMQKAELRQQVTETKQQLKTTPVEGLVSAIQVAGQNQNRLPWQMLPEVEFNLLEAVQTVRERNRFDLDQPIYTVGFSPDGQRLAAAGEAGEVHLWDRQSSAKQVLEGDGQAIGALNFSPDSSALFGNPAHNLGIAQFWTLKPDSPYQAPNRSLSSAAFSSDGQMIISGGINGRVRLWDQKGQSIAKLYPRLGGNVTSVAFEKDSIVTGHEEGQITLWNNKGNLLGTLWAGATIHSLELSQTGQRIISRDLNRQQAFLWNAQAGTWNQFLLGDTKTFPAADLSADNQWVARGSTDGRLELLPLDTQRAFLSQSFLGHTGAIHAVKFSPNGKTVVTGGEDGTMRLWDVNDGLLISRYSLRERVASGGTMVLSRDGLQVAISNQNGTINLGSSLQPSQQMQFKGGKAPQRILHRPDGSLALQTIDAAGHTAISLRDKNGQETAQFTLPTGALRSLDLSTKGQWLSLSEQGNLQLWDVQGKPIGSEIKASPSIQFVRFSPDGEQAITGGNLDGRGATCIWKVTSSGLQSQACQTVGSRTVAFSPDRQQVAIGLDNGHLALWNLQRNQISTWKIHSSSITTIAFSPDGHLIASGNQQGTIRLTNFKGETVGQPFVGNLRPLQALAFTPNQTLVSLSQDGEVRLWQANWQEWLKTACSRLQQHPVFTTPQTDVARAAKATCERQGVSPSPSSPLDSAGQEPVTPPVQPAADQVRLVVKLSERRVYVYRGQTIEATYPLAVGKAGWETPTGTFWMFSMVQNPGWTNPLTGVVLGQGSQTPLGSRWMAFWTDGVQQIGFHATPDRKSVGKAVSHGCLRMYEEDAQALYERVKLGTTVTVEP